MIIYVAGFLALCMCVGIILTGTSFSTTNEERENSMKEKTVKNDSDVEA